MKKFVFAVVLLALLTGCGKTDKSAKTEKRAVQEDKAVKVEKNYFSYLDKLDKKGLQSSSIAFDLMYNNENPEEIKQLSSNIFIARVVSIDKSDSPSNDKKSDMDVAIPYTYGKLEILKNVMGEAPREVDFTRLGGIMKEKDLYRNEQKEFVEKLNRNRKKNGIPLVAESNKLVETLASGDFHLTAGEVYLFYAKWDKGWGKYDLVGFGEGALPVEEGNQPLEETKLAKDEVGKSWKIKNQQTGKKEILSEYLEKKAKVKVRKR